MNFVTWKELLKAEKEKHGDNKPLKGCNVSDDKLRGCFGQHWEKPDGEFIAWTNDRNYYSVRENGLTVVRSSKRKKEKKK